MKLYNEEYLSLIEALDSDPSPSSTQEVTGASTDLFYESLHGKDIYPESLNPQKLSHLYGYVGAVILQTALTYDEVLSPVHKIGILKASARHLDKIPGRNGRRIVVKNLHNLDSKLSRSRVHGPGNEYLRAQVFRLEMDARGDIPSKSFKQLATERFDIIARGIGQQVPLDQMIHFITIDSQE